MSNNVDYFSKKLGFSRKDIAQAIGKSIRTVSAKVNKDSYPVLPIFKLLQKTGGIEEKMMYNTYNMGLGMVLALDPKDVDAAIRAIEEAGEKAYVVGEIIEGDKQVELV